MSTEKLIITGGKVLDPANSVDADKDILIEDGRVAAIDKPGAFKSTKDARIIDAKGKLVTPGLIDIHVHLREPGFEWKETVETGSEAAVAGGFTTICCMPNTNPVNDTAAVTDFIIDAGARAGLARVLPIGAISKKQKGESLAPMDELVEAGCVAFSDDGYPVSDPGLMRKAMEYSLMLDTVLTCHEEEKSLSKDFAMNESSLSVKLGLKGMPGAAEDVMIARDIELARLTGARMHFCHVSTARAVTLIRRAKEDGINVTAEVTPHHLVLTQESVSSFDTAYKMSMPLRTQEDVEALWQGVADGTIDAIASDHAPHELDSKSREFAKASFGIIGLQSTLPLIMSRVREGCFSLERAIDALTAAPARCFKLESGTLAKGAVADIAIIDLERKAEYSAAQVRSKSKNSPFFGWEFQGLVDHTIVGGAEVYSSEELGE